jgi:hypothetical protein
MTDVVTSVPVAAPRRPWHATVAATLLAVMGLGGLAYALATLAVTPGVVDRFRAATADGSDADDLVALLWVGAALGAVLAVILFALYVPLALGLRRGSNGSRIGVWVVCGLGFLAGGISLITVLAQRAGPVTSGSTGQSLADAYPGGWISLNEVLSGLQMAGYVTVAVLLIVAPHGYFGRAARERVDAGPAPYAFGPPATGGPASYPVVPYRASPVPHPSAHGAPYGPVASGPYAPPRGYAAQPTPPGYAAQPTPPGYAAQPTPPGYAFPGVHRPSPGGPGEYPPVSPSAGSQPAPTGFERPAGPEQYAEARPRGIPDPHAETAHDFWRRPDTTEGGGSAASESNDTNQLSE